MKYRIFQPLQICISEIGLGCASYWGKNIFSEKIAINIVRSAIDGGVTVFDTGHSYSEGNAEKRLGKALQGISKKYELCISTKAGTRIGNNGRLYKDFSPQWIRESCIQSLNNLGLEALPMFQLHGPKYDDLNDNVILELKKLKAEGLIRSYGINTFDDNVIKYIIKNGGTDFVMLDYNILTQNRTPLIDELVSKGIACIAGAPLADSLFSNRIFHLRGLKDLWYLSRAIHNFRKKIIKGLHFRFVNNVNGYTGPQIALAFVLSNMKISSTVFGTTSIIHLMENIKASDMVLSHSIVKEIKFADNKRFWFEKA